MIGSSYQLSVFYHGPMSFPQVVSEIFCVGDYIVLSYDDAFEILNQQGRVVQGYSGLQSKFNGGDKTLPVHTALVAEDGSSDFYALFSNQTLTKFTVKITGIVHQVVSSSALDMQLVTSDPMHNSLLWTIDSTNEIFTITDLQTNTSIYQFSAGFDNFMMTETNFVAYKVNKTTPYGPRFYLFDRAQNNLWFISATGNQVKYFHNQEQHMITYLSFTKSIGQCQVYQLNLTSASLSSYLVIQDATACQGEITHAMNIDTKNLQVTIHKRDSNNVDSYTIVSQAFGQVNFVPPNNYGDVKTLVANYDTLSLSHFVHSFEYQNDT
ncbi:MAG: hypothetical protein EOP48_33695 [Sphingobacteriales bacterium]|nr:MAG: hypothetical protein EOP48_33695 [Sphingobacteriales bacterium]